MTSVDVIPLRASGAPLGHACRVVVGEGAHSTAQGRGPLSVLAVSSLGSGGHDTRSARSAVGRIFSEMAYVQRRARRNPTNLICRYFCCKDNNDNIGGSQPTCGWGGPKFTCTLFMMTAVTMAARRSPGCRNRAPNLVWAIGVPLPQW